MLKLGLGLTFGAAVIFAGVKYMNNNTHHRTLRVAFGSPWKNVHPGLQHTLIGDLTLSNQFEALVGFNDNGAYIPLAAKEWIVSPDYKTLTFKIDRSKVFSDGIHLTAQHFKDSWESALKLDPKSSNSSAIDVLYKVEGFSDFAKSGKLTGIRVINDETLEIKFETPFRMALEHLSGNRFSAFREVEGKFIGTGAYLIQEQGEDRLRLTPSAKYKDAAKDDIDLSVVTSKESVQALLDGKIDVMAYAMGGTVSLDLNKHKNLSWLVGQDALHRAIYPNAQKGRLFEKKEFRQALQFLAVKFYGENPSALGNPNFTSVDPQPYLPMQAGRLEETQVKQALAKGEQLVATLLEASKKTPVIVIETEEFSLRPMLEASGIAISPKSRVVSKSELISIIYSGQEADLIPGSFGVASGDPDGLYHLLGRNGAITSPMLKNEAVANLLEEGRKIVDQEKIAPFYQKVSLAILDEAPMIHMGFNKAVAIYRNDLVKVSGRILRRNEGHLHIFEAK